MATAKLISWTEAETRALVAEAARLMLTGTVKSRTAGLIHAMENVLPAAKRRKPGGLMSHVGNWYTPAVIAELARQRKLSATPAHEPAPPPASVITAAPHSGKRVHWNEAEHQALARRCAELQNTEPATTLLQTLRNAQDVLPPERQRHNIQSVKASDRVWLEPLLKKAHAKIRNEQAKAEATAQKAEGPQHLNGTAHAALEAPITPAPIEAPAAVVLAPADPLGAALAAFRPYIVKAAASILGEAFGLAIAEMVKRHAESVTQITPPQQQHEPRPPAPPRAQMPAVLVAGLKGAQKELIKMEFGDRLDLRFYGSDESKDQLKNMVGAADVAVAVTDFLSHSHTDIMKSRALRYVPTGGGMTTLRETLAQLIGGH